MWVALKRASGGLSSVVLKRTDSDVWQLKCQASKSQQVFRVFFATDQEHHIPCSAEIQPMSQQATAATL